MEVSTTSDLKAAGAPEMSSKIESPGEWKDSVFALTISWFEIHHNLLVAFSRALTSGLGNL